MSGYIIKPWEELTITDDYMFKLVMRHKRFCKRLIEKILNIRCRFTIDVRLEGYTKATESRRILVATNFYKRRPDRHVYHTTSEALFAT